MSIDLYRGDPELALSAFMSEPGLTGEVQIFDPSTGFYFDWDDGAFRATPSTDSIPSIQVTGKNSYRAVWDLLGTNAVIGPTTKLEHHWAMSNGEQAAETINVLPAGVEDSANALLARLGELGVVPALVQPGDIVYMGATGVEVRVPTGKEEADLASISDMRIRFQRIKPWPRDPKGAEVLATLDGTDLVYSTVDDDEAFTSCGTWRIQGSYKLGAPGSETQHFTIQLERPVRHPVAADPTPP